MSAVCFACHRLSEREISGVKFEAGRSIGYQKYDILILNQSQTRIHFKAQIQTFSIGMDSSSQYYQTISAEEDCDLNGNHPTQRVTNIFHANRHDFAFPPRTYESPRHIALSRSANMGDILTRTKLHLPQCGDMYDLFDGVLSKLRCLHEVVRIDLMCRCLRRRASPF